MSEQAARNRHRWMTLLLVIATLVVALGAVVAVAAMAGPLNQIDFLRFPLGFYLLAQGLLIGIVALAFWSTRVQEHIDRKLSESEEL
ncbi:MAG TPA: sodium/substrate symporter small subunit [Methyloceanibacter sp.]|nr:sodium/substrate symporter small subunit [Methyloceanibacter sp.]